MSRKKQVNQKITALYCRISLEDGGDNESMSISNQKLMLRDFAEKNGMFQYEYYVDDGYTGRNFNRPSFQRMIADIEAGKIGCVITKDLSRLGRNYIEAGSYIEIFFPKHNVRYIAITDGVDSLTRQEMDITPFKNILNDMYSRDIQAIADSAKKIKEISIEQADSMEQVEVTAERIAEVVQNNSAAAQETSATSEELTAQATTLSGMVSVFKLRQ